MGILKNTHVLFLLLCISSTLSLYASEQSPQSHLFTTTLDYAHMSSLDIEMLTIAQAASNECGRMLEHAIDSGIKSEEEICSTLYFPIHSPTGFPTFSTFYDDYTDTHIRPIEDAFLKKDTRLAYVALLDKNGYVPSHNSIFSQPYTGNRETDIKIHRTKRIFIDVTALRAVKNTGPFLLQVYYRDTGEIFADLSVPVYVKNKHWGAIRVGYRKGS